jgi:hypothetical protein
MTKKEYPNATANERKISAKVIIDTMTKRPVNIICIAVRNSNVNSYRVFPKLSPSTKCYQLKIDDN